MTDYAFVCDYEKSINVDQVLFDELWASAEPCDLSELNEISLSRGWVYLLLAHETWIDGVPDRDFFQEAPVIVNEKVLCGRSQDKTWGTIDKKQRILVLRRKAGKETVETRNYSGQVRTVGHDYVEHFDKHSHQVDIHETRIVKF